MPSNIVSQVLKNIKLQVCTVHIKIYCCFECNGKIEHCNISFPVLIICVLFLLLIPWKWAVFNEIFTSGSPPSESWSSGINLCKWPGGRCQNSSSSPRGYIHLAQNTGQQDCILLQFHALGIKNKHICTLIAKSL